MNENIFSSSPSLLLFLTLTRLKYHLKIKPAFKLKTKEKTELTHKKMTLRCGVKLIDS